MRVQITHLWAPWPDGAQVGDVVDLPKHSSIPAWALGKCFEVATEQATPEPLPEPPRRGRPPKARE
jgi:hypothetical protein